MSMRFTGERVLPDLPELRATFLQSQAVYAFARDRVRDQCVLDCGAGEGYGPAMLAETAARVVALDAASDAMAYAARKYGDADGLAFVAGEAGSLPFEKNSFDVLCCFQVLEHLDDAPGFLFEARRVLRPRGRLVLTTPNRLAAGTGPNPHHVLEYDAEELRELLEIVFPRVELCGVFGSPRVMAYRSKNQRIVRSLEFLDFFGLRYRLPERVRGPLHASMTRVIRGFVRRRNPQGVDALTLDDFPIRDENVGHAVDLLAIATLPEDDPASV